MVERKLINWANANRIAMSIPQYEHRMESDSSIYRMGKKEESEFYIDPDVRETNCLYYSHRPAYFGWGNTIEVPYNLIGAGDDHFVIGTSIPMSIDNSDSLDFLPLDGATFGTILFSNWNMQLYGVHAIDRENKTGFCLELANRNSVEFSIYNRLGRMATKFATNSKGYSSVIDALSTLHNKHFVDGKYFDIFVEDVGIKSTFNV